MATTVEIRDAQSTNKAPILGELEQKPVALVLPVGGSVRGRVTLRETGETVPGLRVFALGEDHLEAVTTADGQFRLDHLPPGPHTLLAAADGLRTVAEAVVEVKEGQEVVGAEIEVTSDE
jgi:hypothetical protein